MLILALADLFAGGVALSPAEVLRGLGGSGVEGEIVLGLRLPRILTALIAGASLALGGTQMQAVFRNPLADPHIMGVSGGAGLGAAIASLATAGSALGMAGGAFAGAVLASALILLAGTTLRGANTLLIFGVLLGFIFSALTSVTEYTASEESIKLFYNWAAGTFSANSLTGVAIMAGAFTISLLISIPLAKGLDISLFGEEFAAYAGASSKGIRLLAILSCCLCTGAVTAFCGPLGFAGIIAPHIARGITGTSVHKVVIPSSIFCGAAIALLADIISQLAPTPLPSGSTLALLGIPLIAAIMLRKV